MLVGAERARDFPKPPVWILGTGEATAHRTITQMRDVTTSDAARVSSMEAFRAADVVPADIDHAMLYDAFSITPMLALEDLGFVKAGESGPFVAEARKDSSGRIIYKTGPGGDFPMNTNGGGLSYCHTGKYGMFALTSAARVMKFV